MFAEVPKNKEMLLNSLKELNLKNYFVAGGSINDIYRGEKIQGDIDIFFYTEKDYRNAVQNNPGDDYRLTKNAYTFIHNDLVIQFIKKNFGTPQEIMKEFDLNKSRIALVKDEFIFGEYYHDDLHIINKNIRVDTFKRYLKYSKRFFVSNNNISATFYNYIINLMENIRKIENYYEDKPFLQSDELAFKEIQDYKINPYMYFNDKSVMINLEKKYPEMFL